MAGTPAGEKARREGSATWRRPRLRTAARATTPACARSRGERTLAGARRGASTPAAGRLRRLRGSSPRSWLPRACGASPLPRGADDGGPQLRSRPRGNPRTRAAGARPSRRGERPAGARSPERGLPFGHERRRRRTRRRAPRGPGCGRQHLGAAQRPATAPGIGSAPRPAAAASARPRRRAPGAPRARRGDPRGAVGARATTSSFTPVARRAGESSRTSTCSCSPSTDGHDWLLVIDDDVELPRGFLDRFLFLCERFSLALAQPAHRLDSHAAWPVTRRRRERRARHALRGDRPGDGVRQSTFAVLLPFPELRMGWGLDVHWAALAREHGWRCGVVDAVSIRHRAAPAAAAYGREAASPRRARSCATAPMSARTRPTAPLLPTAAGERPARAGRAWRSWPSSTRAAAIRSWASGRTARRSRRATRARTSVFSSCTDSYRRAARSRAGRGRPASARRAVREPRNQTRDGLEITYLPYVSPPRERSYAAGGPGRPRRSGWP